MMDLDKNKSFIIMLCRLRWFVVIIKLIIEEHRQIVLFVTVVAGFVYSCIKNVISPQHHIVGDWLNICGRTNFCIFCLFFLFQG